MYFTIIDKKPWLLGSGGVAFQCAITAQSVTAEFKHKIKLETPEKKYTLTEIRQVLGIKLIDKWDAKKEAVGKKSNKTVSSITKEAPIFEDPDKKKPDEVIEDPDKKKPDEVIEE